MSDEFQEGQRLVKLTAAGIAYHAARAKAADAKPDDYRSNLGVEYKAPACQGYTVIDVLPFLVGRPWDAIALAYVHALRPSSIRVHDVDCWKMNARNWRVTVLLESDSRTIRWITQEVAVGLPAGIENGYDLDWALKRKPDA